MKKPLKITLIVLGSIVGLILLVAALLSPVATAYVNRNGEKLVGRKLTVDRIRANILTGHVAIHGLKLYEDDAITEFVTFDTLDVKARLLRLVVSDLYFSHITLVNPNVRLVQNGSHFNFQSLIDHFKSDDDDDDDDDTPSKWDFYFYNIRLAGGEVRYNDIQRGSDWRLKGLNLEVPGFCIGADEKTDAGLSVELADGGRLHADAKYNMERNDFEAVLDLYGINMAVAKPYVTDVLNISNVTGKLSAHLRAEGNLDQAAQMNISGRIDMDGMNMVLKDGSSFSSCDKSSVTVRRVNIHDKVFDLDSVIFSGLAARFDRYQDGNNFSRLMVKKEKDSDSTQLAEAEPQPVADTVEPEPKKPVCLTISHFLITNSSFTYADHTLPDVFEFPMSSLSIQSENLTLNGENNAVLRAELPGGGHVDLRWKGNILQWKEHQDLMLRIKGLDLKRISPYSVAYFGRPFTDGTFSFMSHNTINSSTLSGKNRVDIYKAEVGDKRRDVDAQLKIPFKAALYVLKDKDDKILFDIPVKGNIDNPEFSYMKLVWKTIGNLLVKVATSPIRAIASAMGMGDVPEFIKVDPKQRDFTSEQYHQFAELASIVKSNEGVHLTLDQQVDSTADGELLARYAHRNELVLQYMTGQEGVSAEQVTVTTTMTPGLKQSGYAVSSETTDEFEE